MRHAPRALLAGGLGFAVSLLVACGASGGGGLLSSDQARNLNSSLAQVSASLAAKDCGAASSELRSLSNAVANLPPSVNTTLQQNLNQGAITVAQLASRCHSASTATTTTPKTTPTASTPSTQSTTTTTSAPAPTTTTSPAPPTTSTGTTVPSGTGQGTTPTGPPSGGGGLPGGGPGNSPGNGSGPGNGNGNGKGNGNGH